MLNFDINVTVGAVSPKLIQPEIYFFFDFCTPATVAGVPISPADQFATTTTAEK